MPNSSEWITWGGNPGGGGYPLVVCNETSAKDYCVSQLQLIEAAPKPRTPSPLPSREPRDLALSPPPFRAIEAQEGRARGFRPIGGTGRPKPISLPVSLALALSPHSRVVRNERPKSDGRMSPSAAVAQP